MCNGLGPALFGFIFYLFHVDLNENNDGDTGHKPGHVDNHTVHKKFGTSKDVSILLAAS